MNVSRITRPTLLVVSLTLILALAGCGGGGGGGGSTSGGGSPPPPVPTVPHEFFIAASAGANAGVTSASITNFSSGSLGTAVTQPLSNAEAVIVHPNNQFVYAANGGQTLSSFAIDPTSGALSLNDANIGQSIGGGGASFQLKSLAIDPGGQFVVAISAGALVQDVQFFITGQDGHLSSGTEFISAAQLNGVPSGVALTTIGGKLVLLVLLDQAANNVVATTLTFDGTNLTTGIFQTATAGGAGVQSASAISVGRQGTTTVAYVTTREGGTGGLTAIPLTVSGGDVTPLTTEVVQSTQTPAISVTSDSAGHVYVGLLDTSTNVEGFTFDATGLIFATNGVLGSTTGQANVSDVLLDPGGQGRFLYASNDSGSVSNISVFTLGTGGVVPASSTGFSVGDTVQQLTAVKTLGF